jgi:hypothetical protein
MGEQMECGVVVEMGQKGREGGFWLAEIGPKSDVEGV